MIIYHPNIENYIDKGWKIVKKNSYHVTLEKKTKGEIIKLPRGSRAVEIHLNNGWEIIREDKNYIILETKSKRDVIKISLSTGATIKGPMEYQEFYHGISKEKNYKIGQHEVLAFLVLSS